MSTAEPIRRLEKKRYFAGLLELACEELELPPSKWEAAKTAYEAVGGWLNDCPVLRPYAPQIFPQGSAALLTTVKPLGHEEYDIDLICFLAKADDSLHHATVKKWIGDRLRAHAVYARMLSEYKRCWRLDYSKESRLHLDGTPAVKRAASYTGSLSVPDKDLKAWHESNPAGYRSRFERAAEKTPRMTESMLELSASTAVKAEVAPMPEQIPIKGHLRRTVQLAKRHRSLHFEHNPRVAPISVIITTLAMHAYERVVDAGIVFESDFDVVVAILQRMPEFVEFDGLRWSIPNPTTISENFAEKWNSNPALAAAFYDWHRKALADFRELAESADSPRAFEILGRIIGVEMSSAVREKATTIVDRLRVARRTHIGISTGGTLTAGVVRAAAAIPPNTFWGAR